MAGAGLRALAILGPTGAGKSAYAMALAQWLPIEIVSVDSAQVYRGLDIGTAKPTPAERAAVPHHLIDICEPQGVYSAGEFRRDALALIAAIQARGRLPVLVGGTMLYFRALFRGMAELPQADKALRARLDARAAELGWPALHAELSRLDPLAAARIHVNDAQRIQRALEVQALGGAALSTLWQQGGAGGEAVDYRIIVLEPASRELLHQRLAERLDAMLSAGLVAEVRQLLAQDTLDHASPALRLVGYRQLLAYCAGRESLPDARDKALFATRQLAKRQLTWLRSASLYPPGNQPLRFDPTAPDSLELFRLAVLQTWSFAPATGA